MSPVNYGWEDIVSGMQNVDRTKGFLRGEDFRIGLPRFRMD